MFLLHLDLNYYKKYFLLYIHLSNSLEETFLSLLYAHRIHCTKMHYNALRKVTHLSTTRHIHYVKNPLLRVYQSHHNIM